MKQKQQLFLAHAQDLNHLFPDVTGCFVCPICFRVFRLADLERPNTLSVGHVWPEHYFRSRSHEADQQIVLLCSTCNSKGGETYDAAMQIMEQSKALESIGEPYDTRFVSIFSSSDPNRNVRLPLFVIESPERLSSAQLQKVKASNGIVLNFDTATLALFPQIDAKGNKHYNEKEWTKAKEIVYSEMFTITIESYKSDWIKGKVSDIPQLWRSGLLAAAYLYAFYTFGYRYIFQNVLDPVRGHIMQAMEREAPRLSFDPSQPMNVALSPVYFEHPDIGFFNPSASRSEVHHMRVSFLEYAVWLPLRVAYPLSWKQELGSFVESFVVSMRGHQPHMQDVSLWNVLFGEPDYILAQDQIYER